MCFNGPREKWIKNPFLFQGLIKFNRSREKTVSIIYKALPKHQREQRAFLIAAELNSSQKYRWSFWQSFPLALTSLYREVGTCAVHLRA